MLHNEPASRADPWQLSLAQFGESHQALALELRALLHVCAQPGAAPAASDTVARHCLAFQQAMSHHHAEEESELFPAVLEAAGSGPLAARARDEINHLTGQHRTLEAQWQGMRPVLEAADANTRAAAHERLQAFVTGYLGHAQHEEGTFLPFARALLRQPAGGAAAE